MLVGSTATHRGHQPAADLQLGNQWFRDRGRSSRD
jgi:hypothetical protein